MYADDIQLRCIFNPQELHDDEYIIHRKHNLKMNQDNSAVIVIAYAKVNGIEDNLSLHFEGMKVPILTWAKPLGLAVDKKLKLIAQINFITRKKHF